MLALLSAAVPSNLTHLLLGGTSLVRPFAAAAAPPVPAELVLPEPSEQQPTTSEQQQQMLRVPPCLQVIEVSHSSADVLLLVQAVSGALWPQLSRKLLDIAGASGLTAVPNFSSSCATAVAATPNAATISSSAAASEAGQFDAAGAAEVSQRLFGASELPAEGLTMEDLRRAIGQAVCAQGGKRRTTALHAAAAQVSR